jgi:iron-sulfur cluster assembly accessory protein
MNQSILRLSALTVTRNGGRNILKTSTTKGPLAEMVLQKRAFSITAEEAPKKETEIASLPIDLTERAKDRVRFLRAQGNNPDLKLRLTVEGGGCSGFSYKFSVFGGQPEPDDLVIGDPPVVIDQSSLEFVKGSKIDFTEDLIRRSFEVINNPQSESRCGCGASFALKTEKKKKA